MHFDVAQFQTRDRVFLVDKWSSYQWGRACDEAEDLRALVEDGRRKLFSYPAFAKELFARLHGGATPLDQMRPEDGWAEKAHRALDDLPSFQQLRSRCLGDRFLAALSTVELGRKVLESLPEPPENTEDPEAVREQVRGLLAFASQKIDSGQFAPEVRERQETGRSLVAGWVEHGARVDDSELRSALRAAVDHGHEAIDEVEQHLSAWGTGCSTTGAPTGLGLKAQLARQIAQNPRLRQIAEQAGRLKRIAIQKHGARPDRSPSELTEIEMGSDLQRLLPVELAKLCDAKRWLEFARGYVEGALLQYALEGSEPLGRGPVVVCLDESSSMEGPREIWSKALTLALLQIATLEHRWVRVVRFNGDVVRVDDWPPGHIDPLDLIESMSTTYPGGTAFEPPLRSALDAIQREPGLAKADVILVTDGEAPVSEEFSAEWKRQREQLGFTCYAVHVDAAGGVPPTSLRRIADHVIGLSDVRSDGAATDALFAL